jgi:hypothetical protein
MTVKPNLIGGERATGADAEASLSPDDTHDGLGHDAMADAAWCGVARCERLQKTAGFALVARRKPQRCPVALRGFATTPRVRRRGFMS